MRNYFEEPELEVVRLEETDIICASSCGGAGENEIGDNDTCPSEM